MTQETKPWYTSRTIWGSLVAVVAALLAALGLPLDQNSQVLLTDVILQIIAVCGSLFAIFGRLGASAQIE